MILFLFYEIYRQPGVVYNWHNKYYNLLLFLKLILSSSFSNILGLLNLHIFLDFIAKVHTYCLFSLQFMFVTCFTIHFFSIISLLFYLNKIFANLYFYIILFYPVTCCCALMTNKFVKCVEIFQRNFNLSSLIESVNFLFSFSTFKYKFKLSKTYSINWKLRKLQKNVACFKENANIAKKS